MSLEMKYFVLKPRAKGKDDKYAEASQNAMLLYADIIRNTDPQLSDELEAWAGKEAFRQGGMK